MPTQKLHAWLDPATAVPGPPGLPRVIADEGVQLPVRSIVDMRGAGVTATDDPANDKTIITIPGTGAQGANFEYTFSTNTVAPPGNAQLRLNNADQTLATTLWVDNDTAGGADVTNVLGMIQPDSELYIQEEDDSLKWQRYRVTDYPTVAQGTYTTIPVEWLRGGDPLVNNQRVRMLVLQQATTDWQDIQNKPATFPPSAHTHPWTEITSKPLVFPPETHQHPAADVTSGIFDPARLGAGVASNSVYLRGDGQWAGVSVGQVAGAVPNTVQIIAGTGMTGGGALTGSVTLNANIAAIQSPWVGNIDGAGFALNYPKQIIIRANPLNTTGAESYTGLILDRTYGDTGDTMDVVWPSAARISVNATGAGEKALVFYAQTASGNGETNEVMRFNGNGTLQMPKGGMDVYRGTPNGFVGTPGTQGSWLGTFVNYSNASSPGNGCVFATAWGGSDFPSSTLAAGSVNPGPGTFVENFSVRGNGVIMLRVSVSPDAAQMAAGIMSMRYEEAAGVLHFYVKRPSDNVLVHAQITMS